MLLGIVLHGALSFIPGIESYWGVEDSQPSAFFGILMSAIHGWRMPLFFLVSGFFTAMLWKKRGIQSLLAHRFKRIFLPMVLALLTIVPAIWVVTDYIRSQPKSQTVNKLASGEESEDGEQREQVPKAEQDFDVNAAVLFGDLDGLSLWLENGGEINVKDPYGSTALHVACLFGKADAAKLLLEAGADLNVRNKENATPKDLLGLDWKTTAYIAGLFKIPVVQDDVLQGRKQIAEVIGQQVGETPAVMQPAVMQPANDPSDGMQQLFGLLFYFPVFYHLWFLWFLCWFVCGFALIVKLLQLLKVPAISNRWLTSPLRYAWLIPLAAMPQYFMATSPHAYGPDTSVGLLPLPAVFVYYAIFFAYGAMYFGADDQAVKVGKGYGWKLPMAVLLLFPIGLSLQGPDDPVGRFLFASMQVSYAWVMSFGMMGLFAKLCRSGQYWIRYLSDSSYWLYLAHIPLVLLLQFFVRDWQVPAVLKFGVVCAVATVILLITYHLLVRNTLLGVLLNGRRYPGQKSGVATTSVSSQTATASAIEESR